MNSCNGIEKIKIAQHLLKENHKIKDATLAIAKEKKRNMQDHLQTYKTELQAELESILKFWMHRAMDNENGGFYGQIDYNNKVHKAAPKGSVLNSRILWSFSAAYRQTGNRTYLQLADRAYRYISDYFIDGEWGGVYWTVDYRGVPLDTKKQIYALSFALYALSEYHQCGPSDKVLQQAVNLYQTIVEKSYDTQFGGYIEALTRDWQPIADLRLSEKDVNEKKSMNTHLHVLEGFTNLYRIWPDENLKKKIRELVKLFLNHIIDNHTNHLILFFDEAWKPKSNIISYGHDIEAAWLVQEAAEVIGDEALLGTVKERSVRVAKAAARGLDVDGGLWYEFDNDALHLIKEKHWWPQSEAMVGFLNAYENTGDESFLKHALQSWSFIKKHILDAEGGEWYWGVKEDYTKMEEDKAGLWKCPYHNSRACIEVINRIDQLSKLQKKNETF